MFNGQCVNSLGLDQRLCVRDRETVLAGAGRVDLLLRSGGRRAARTACSRLVCTRVIPGNHCHLFILRNCLIERRNVEMEFLSNINTMYMIRVIS